MLNNRVRMDPNMSALTYKSDEREWIKIDVRILFYCSRNLDIVNMAHAMWITKPTMLLNTLRPPNVVYLECVQNHKK